MEIPVITLHILLFSTFLDSLHKSLFQQELGVIG